MEMKAEHSGGSGGRKKQREYGREKKKVILSMREGQQKKARREWKSVGWEERRERERRGKSGWSEGKLVKGGGNFIMVYSDLLLLPRAGCPIPPPSQSRRTEREGGREGMRFAASYLVTFLMFHSSMKSVLSKHFRFHLVSIREEAQYFSLSLSVFFIVIFWFYQSVCNYRVAFREEECREFQIAIMCME